MSTPKPKFKCRAKVEAECHYHGVFIQMNQAAARKDYLAYEKAAEQANELNKNVRQLKEKERLQVDYDSQFDAPVSTARLTESVKGLFGRKKPQGLLSRFRTHPLQQKVLSRLSILSWLDLSHLMLVERKTLALMKKCMVSYPRLTRSLSLRKLSKRCQ